MAEAPTYGGPQVRSNSLPAPLVNPGIASADAFGAPIAEGAGRLAETHARFEQVKEERQAKYDQEEAEKKREIDVFAQANKAKSEITAATAKARQVQGSNAEGLTQRTRADFDKIKEKYAKDLADPEARDAFDRQMEMSWRDVDSVVTNHAESEIANYRRQEYESATVNERNSALMVDTPERIAESLEMQAASRKLAGANLGEDADTVARRVAKDAEDTITAAIKQRQAAKDLNGARVYLDQFGDRLPKGIRAEIKADLDNAEVSKKAQTYAAAIMQDPGQTKAKAFQQLKMIDDPELRERATVNVQREFAQREAIRQEAQATTYEEAFDAIDAGKSYDEIVDENPAIVGLLDANETKALRQAEEHVINRTEPEEWGPDYTAARNAARDFPDDFASTKNDLRLLKGKVRKSEYDDLNERQQAIRALQTKANGKGSDLSKGFLTVDQQVKAALRSIDLDPTEMPKGAERSAAEKMADRFTMLMDKKVRAAGGASKVTPEQVKQFADDLILEKEFVDPASTFGKAMSYTPVGWVFGAGKDGTKKVRAFDIPGYENAAFAVDQIPAADQSKAIKALADAGITDPTPDEIIEWHNGTIIQNAKAP